MKSSQKVWKFLKKYNFAWKFKLQVCLPLFLVLVGIDWITKGVVQGTMVQGETVAFLPGFLTFSYIINPGSAYGFNANNLALAVSLASVMTFLLIVIFIFANGKAWLIGLTIILAGSFANLLARAWAPAVANATSEDLNGLYGGVIDFLHWDFGAFGSNDYVFNFADVWVILGVVAFFIGIIVDLILTFKKKKYETDEEYGQEIKESNSKKEKVVNKGAKPVVFKYQDESKLKGEALKRYQKELKAYKKMEKMEVKKHGKKVR